MTYFTIISLWTNIALQWHSNLSFRLWFVLTYSGVLKAVQLVVQLADYDTVWYRGIFNKLSSEPWSLHIRSTPPCSTSRDRVVKGVTEFFKAQFKTLACVHNKYVHNLLIPSFSLTIYIQFFMHNDYKKVLTAPSVLEQLSYICY